MVRRIIIIGTVFLFLFILYNLFNQIRAALDAGNRLDSQLGKLTHLQRKNSELKKKLEDVQTPQFIEEQARDKLNLTRDGETIVIIPESEIKKALGMDQLVEEVHLPNWQGWLKLFLH
jgi:cell division protein FtsB